MKSAGIAWTCVFATLLVANASARTPGARPADLIGTSIGTDLSLDTGFGSDGSAIANFNDASGTLDQPLRVTPTGDGGYWLLGFHRPDAFANDAFAIAKLRADGSLDPVFGNGGQLIAAVDIININDAVLGDDGRFYVAGLHQATPTDDARFGVACVEMDGTPCAGFGDNGSVVVAFAPPGFGDRAILIAYRDGALFAIGNTDPGGGDFGHSSAIAVAKLDAATGALDTAFGNFDGGATGRSVFDIDLYPGGFDYALATAFGADGNGGFNVLVAGSAQTAQNQSSAAYVLAFDPATGLLNASFGDNGVKILPLQLGAHLDQVSATALSSRADGRVLVAGGFNHDDADFNISNELMLAALNADGSLAADFAGGGLTHYAVGFNTETTALAERADGRFVVTLQSNGLAPDEYYPFNLQSIAEFDANGNGPIATASVQFESDPEQSPLARPTSVIVDADNRVLMAGLRLWGYPNYPAPDFDFTLTRFVSDTIFANGFEAAPQRSQ